MLSWMHFRTWFMLARSFQTHSFRPHLITTGVIISLVAGHALSGLTIVFVYDPSPAHKRRWKQSETAQPKKIHLHTPPGYNSGLFVLSVTRQKKKLLISWFLTILVPWSHKKDPRNLEENELKTSIEWTGPSGKGKLTSITHTPRLCPVLSKTKGCFPLFSHLQTFSCHMKICQRWLVTHKMYLNFPVDWYCLYLYRNCNDPSP